MSNKIYVYFDESAYLIDKILVKAKIANYISYRKEEIEEKTKIWFTKLIEWEH